MMSSVIPARLVFQCGHAALVSLPRIKGETSSQRADRVAREKSAAHTRACDFCGQRLEVVVQQAAPAPTPAPVPAQLPPPPPVVAAAPPVAPLAAPVEAVPLAEWHAERIAQAKPRASVKPKVVPAAKQPEAAPVAKQPEAAPVAKRPVGRPPRVATPPSPVTNGVAAPTHKSAPNGRRAHRVKKLAPNGRVATRAKTPAPNGRAAGGARFTVQFQQQTVLHAVDMRDALRQAQSLGAIEVLAITWEN